MPIVKWKGHMRRSKIKVLSNSKKARYFNEIYQYERNHRPSGTSWTWSMSSLSQPPTPLLWSPHMPFTSSSVKHSALNMAASLTKLVTLPRKGFQIVCSNLEPFVAFLTDTLASMQKAIIPPRMSSPCTECGASFFLVTLPLAWQAEEAQIINQPPLGSLTEPSSTHRRWWNSSPDICHPESQLQRSDVQQARKTNITCLHPPVLVLVKFHIPGFTCRPKEQGIHQLRRKEAMLRPQLDESQLLPQQGLAWPIQAIQAT